MNWDWTEVKERLQRAYHKLSQLLIFLAFCFYLLACIVAGEPVGAKGYVSFVNHCFQWQPQPQVATSVTADQR